MKLLQFLPYLLLTPTCFSEIRLATTKEDLLAKREELSNNQNRSLIQPLSEEVAVGASPGKSIMDSSSYLVGELGYTLIPDGSAISIDKPYALTKTKPENLAYFEWAEFVRNHRNKLQVIQVTEKLLKPEADTQLVLDRVAALKNLGNTCVTTFKQQPVRIAQSQTPPKS